MLLNGHLEVIFLIYIIFSVVEMISIIRNIYESHHISIMSMCRVMYVMLLCVIPAFILWGQKDGIDSILSISFEEKDLWTFYLQLILTIIGYYIFRLGYSIKQKNYPEKIAQGEQKVVLTAIIFSAISFVSLLLWASGYEGVRGLLENANEIRAGWLVSSNSFAFFKHFVPLALLASWMLFNALIRNMLSSAIHKIAVVLLLACDIVISSIYIQANDGRMLLAVYILLFFIIYLKYIYEFKSVNIIPIILRFCIILLVVIIILVNADNILRYMRGNDIVADQKFEGLDTVTSEFSFIISGTQKALSQWNSENFNLMIKNDVVNGLFAWLPSFLKPVTMEDVWDHNTKLLSSSSYGQSPTSIIAQSLYDLSWIGIIIIPFLYGMLVKKAEKILEAHKNSIFYETVYVALGFYLCKGIPYFSLYNIMINTFFIFVGVVIYTVLHKVKM